MAAQPFVAAAEGCLVDVVVPGDAADVVRWAKPTEAVTLAAEDPNPCYDEGDRLWHLRFRAERRGTVELRLVRERPGRRPLRTRVTLRIGPERPAAGFGH
ncbi:MAG: hypothetical protein ABR511_07370 [Acidimicrobiales bacterium]